MGVGDRLGVDAGPSLELPDLLAIVEIERDELAGLLAGEQKPTAGWSVSGTRHFGCPVSGSSASIWPIASPGLTGVGRFSMN